MVSARSVKIGPSELLAGNSAPVAGSNFMITPEAGEATGITDSAVATLESRAPAKSKTGGWGVNLSGVRPFGVRLHPAAVQDVLLAIVPANGPDCCTVA